MLGQLLDDVVNLIYPPRCASCAADDRPGEFCADCGGKLSELEAAPACPRCAAPLGDGSACPYCGGIGIHPFATIAALGPFRDPLRRMIHKMKYRHGWPIAEILAQRMLDHPRTRIVLQQTDCLVAVPLHGARQFGRGYNQAHTIAAQLSRRCDIRLVHPLVRAQKHAVANRRGRAARSRG